MRVDYMNPNIVADPELTTLDVDSQFFPVIGMLNNAKKYLIKLQ